MANCICLNTGWLTHHAAKPQVFPREQNSAPLGEMALAMTHRLRREGLRFAYPVFDAGYGHLPWLLTALDDERAVFLAEVHSDQTIYLTDPCPILPERRSAKGKAPTLHAAYLTRRVGWWDGVESKARCGLLLVRRELDGTDLKCCLSNAKFNVSLCHLVTMQGARHFVERAFEEAKGHCGMADYQVRCGQA